VQEPRASFLTAPSTFEIWFSANQTFWFDVPTKPNFVRCFTTFALLFFVDRIPSLKPQMQAISLVCEDFARDQSDDRGFLETGRNQGVSQGAERSVRAQPLGQRISLRIKLGSGVLSSLLVLAKIKPAQLIIQNAGVANLDGPETPRNRLVHS
jgi:hypothetical protein